MKVVWLPQAAHSLDLEYEYLARRNPRAAKSVFARIVAMTRQLKDFPNSGRAGQVPGTRELIIPDVPYLVIYRVTSDQVEILRVFHTSRDWPELLMS